MSVEENKAIARRLFEEGLTKEDLDTLDEIIAPDILLHGNNISSKDGYKSYISRMHLSFPDWQYVVVDLIAEGDKVAVRWTGSGTQTGKWGGFAPTNKSIEWGGTTTLRFADGKITEEWDDINMFWFLRQLDLVPTWEELIGQANAKQA